MAPKKPGGLRKVPPKFSEETLARWVAELAELKYARSVYLHCLRDRDNATGAPYGLSAKLQRILDRVGGLDALVTSPPAFLSFKDSFHKQPKAELDFSGMCVNDWLSTLAFRTIPPGVPIKPSVCRTLLLRETDVTDGSMKHIGKLKFIHTLSVAKCEALTDATLTLIRRTLAQLSVLHIDECRNFSSDVLIATWTDCTKLHSLSAMGCPAVTDRFLHCVATTKRQPGALTRYLDVSKCRNITDAGITDVADCKHEMELTYFAFGHCLQVQSMAFFAFETSKTLGVLETLDIPSLDLDEAAVSWLVGGCRRLKKLNLAHCLQINDFCLLLLAQCTRLRWLSLNGCYRVTSRGLANLFSKENTDTHATQRHVSLLEYLNVRNCYEINNDGLDAIGGACTDLQHLNLQGLSHISDAGIMTVAKHCTQLRHLVLSGCRNELFYGRPDIGDETLAILSKLCRRMTSLDVTGGPRVSTHGVMLVAANCHSLLELYVGDTPIDDAAVIAVARHCRDLHTLHLSKCPQLTDKAVAAIASSLFRLEHLTLSHCSHLTNQSLLALAASRIELRFLDLTGNANITDDGLVALVTGCDKLRDVRLRGCERLTESCLRRCTLALPFCASAEPASPSKPGAKMSVFEMKPVATTWRVLFEKLLAQYSAAELLQACARKWRQRDLTLQSVSKRKRLRERRAACRIQRAFRAHLKWVVYLRSLQHGKRRDILLHVQAIYRGNACRRRVRAYREVVLHLSLCVQRAAKHHLYRRHGHARTLQRVFRGHRGRREAAARRHAILVAASTRLVRWFQRCLRRRDFRQRCGAIARNVRLIQRSYRRFYRLERLRAMLRLLYKHVTAMQAAVRGGIARRAVRRRRAEWTAGALCIQSTFRMHRTRVWFVSYRKQIVAAAIRVQTWGRQRIAMRHWPRAKAAVRRVQRRFRTYRAVHRFYGVATLRLARNGDLAARLIQRVFRGHRGRCRARLFRKIQHCTYAVQGQNAVELLYRRRFLRRGAALVLQRWVRATMHRIRVARLGAWRAIQAGRCIGRYLIAWFGRVVYQKRRTLLLALTLDLQRVYRGHRGRCIYRARRLAYRRLVGAIEMERITRGFLARRFTSHMRTAFTKAALLVQRVYRGKLGRRIAAIERAKLVLEAKDVYLKSVRGALASRIYSLPMKEQKCLMERQVELLERTKRMLVRRRVGYEKKMVQVRASRRELWALANDAVGEHYHNHRKMVGASENVYVTKIERDTNIARRAALTAELTDIHVKMMRFKKALRDKINETRVMEPSEFWEVATATGIFDMQVPHEAS
ncbi:hypothetical protein SPRG_02235 [Saprolegnia parasitica CBS 223.65]|uniref:F-box/LRR-repeat protein 15-like leucin rich repeat domain-containing protein n=1 Tax=Saprolegnia parasitica (strain CBS 223.65) TaxID=695850 RepID=A0A067CSD0_SAPPC|nr:hypothetical protein SPRG_02235 [Saprolegnia parasitica CBS 223.65]KDO33428.1 hypothetical protein SPRG_02235 [Saprolegnia parasitica CBS 223.65]|eukprot:XP_012196174.1 hypothetical protein SPRG_02235 [Saprolegnia parasitica CBS 223.65]